MNHDEIVKQLCVDLSPKDVVGLLMREYYSLAMDNIRPWKTVDNLIYAKEFLDFISDQDEPDKTSYKWFGAYLFLWAINGSPESVDKFFKEHVSCLKQK